MRAALGLAAVPLAAACSLMSSLDGLTPPPADAGLDAPIDAYVPTPDASNDAGVDASKPADAAVDPASFGRLELWVRADDVTLDDAGALASWPDHSPAKHVVDFEAVGKCQSPPTMGVMNKAMPGVAFDGYTQCLQLSGGFPNFSGGLTAFVVMEPSNGNSSFSGSAGAVLDLWDGNTQSISIRRNPKPAQTASGDGMLSIDNDGAMGAVAIAGGTSWVPGQEQLLEFHLPPAPGGTLVAGTAFVNGALATVGENDPLIPYLMGASSSSIGILQSPGGNSYNLYCGMIGEMLLYSKALSDADRMSVEGYLKSKWGL